MRPVPTKWETSCKISFLSYNQIHVVQTLSFNPNTFAGLVEKVQKNYLPKEEGREGGEKSTQRGCWGSNPEPAAC